MDKRDLWAKHWSTWAHINENLVKGNLFIQFLELQALYEAQKYGFPEEVQKGLQRGVHCAKLKNISLNLAQKTSPREELRKWRAAMICAYLFNEETFNAAWFVSLVCCENEEDLKQLDRMMTYE